MALNQGKDGDQGTPQDIGYQGSHLQGGKLKHLYGPNLHLLSDPYHLSLLARLSSEATFQPEISHLVTTLYRVLVARVLAEQIPTVDVVSPTRMISATPFGVYRGKVIDPSTKVVCVDIARAGMLPTQVCFDALNHVLNPAGVRQDHIVMNRVTDDKGHVIGARIFGEKVGGDIAGQIVVFPDPMGATGSSLLEAIGYYRGLAQGAPTKMIAMNLIVTPEFVQNVHRQEPDLIIYAFRLDRGLSAPHILNTLPGTHPDQERGLNEHHYIVPGAGGLGEVINNVE